MDIKKTVIDEVLKLERLSLDIHKSETYGGFFYIPKICGPL